MTLPRILFHLALGGVLAGVLGVALTGCSPSPPPGPILRFTGWPNPDHEGAPAAKDVLLANALSDALGVPVECVPVTDFGASYRAFTSGDAQLAWFGGVTGVQARDAVRGARAIACGTIDRHYRSYVVAHASVGATLSKGLPEALRGRRFTFGRPDSMSGRVMPQHFLSEAAGEALTTYFGEVGYAGGSHDNVARLVESGTWDAGVLNYRVYDELVASGALDPEACVKVWETPRYHNFSWSAHPRLESTFGEGFIDRLQDALTRIDDPMLLDALRRPNGMTRTSNEAFNLLEGLCRELELLRDES